jgi:signal transduction histidine kinase
MSIALVYVMIKTSNQPNYFSDGNVAYVYGAEAKKLMQEDTYTQVTDQVTLYASGSHNYILVFPEQTVLPDPYAVENDSFFIPFLFILLMVAIVYVTNLLLTRFIFKSIMSPIDTLVKGVHEIRDGNLSHRIDYKKKDEFTAVCADFNEMATRLLDSVNQRQKDEQNRRELIVGISHDLRTPLTSIKSYVKGLQDGVAKNPDKVKEYLEVTYRKTCEMEGLIDHLFLFSKLDTDNFPFHFKALSIHHFLVSTWDAFQYDVHSNNATLTLNSQCSTQKVLLDGEQMQRVLFNIVENSIKHNKGKAVHIDISLRQVADHVILRLQDNGTGVPAEQLPRLFELFYRGDESRSKPANGNGLGLSIARKIVTAHGGTLTAENGNGLAIIIELPLVSEGIA